MRNCQPCIIFCTEGWMTCFFEQWKYNIASNTIVECGKGNLSSPHFRLTSPCVLMNTEYYAWPATFVRRKLKVFLASLYVVLIRLHLIALSSIEKAILLYLWASAQIQASNHTIIFDLTAIVDCNSGGERSLIGILDGFNSIRIFYKYQLFALSKWLGWLILVAFFSSIDHHFFFHSFVLWLGRLCFFFVVAPQGGSITRFSSVDKAEQLRNTHLFSLLLLFLYISFAAWKNMLHSGVRNWEMYLYRDLEHIGEQQINALWKCGMLINQCGVEITSSTIIYQFYSFTPVQKSHRILTFRFSFLLFTDSGTYNIERKQIHTTVVYNCSTGRLR